MRSYLRATDTHIPLTFLGVYASRGNLRSRMENTALASSWRDLRTKWPSSRFQIPSPPIHTRNTFELAVQEQDHSPASCGLRGAAHDRALDQFQAACAAVGIVNRFTTWDGNKRAPDFHDLFSLYRQLTCRSTSRFRPEFHFSLVQTGLTVCRNRTPPTTPESRRSVDRCCASEAISRSTTRIENKRRQEHQHSSTLVRADIQLSFVPDRLHRWIA
jgi:hypothetical protein